MLERNGFIDENIEETSLILPHSEDDEQKNFIKEGVEIFEQNHLVKEEEVFEQNSSNEGKEQNDLDEAKSFEQNSSKDENVQIEPTEEFLEQNGSNEGNEQNDLMEEIFEQNSYNDEVKVVEPEVPPKARSADPMSRGRCCSGSRCCCCCCCYVSPKSLIAAKSLDRLAIDLSSQSSRALRHISPSPPSGNFTEFLNVGHN